MYGSFLHYRWVERGGDQESRRERGKSQSRRDISYAKAGTEEGKCDPSRGLAVAPRGQEWGGGQGLEQRQQRDGFAMKRELVWVPEKRGGASCPFYLGLGSRCPLCRGRLLLPFCLGHRTHPQGPAPVHLLFEAVHHLPPPREQSEENKRTGHPGSLPRGGVA